LIQVEFALAAITLAALLFVIAPYGRHARRGWGPTIPARVGWIVMESPAVIFFAAVYAAGPHRSELAPLVLLALWMVHYLHRAFIFPMRMRASGRRMPVLIAVLAIAFNLLNGWNNARWLSTDGSYPTTWLTDPRFLGGSALFLAGFVGNLVSDIALLRLRPPGETGYRIPRGGLFELVSSPNYLSEIVGWFGWALATWSPAGLAFAVYVVANLAPRALSHHAWYRKQFADYPGRRKALIPFVL
jgi:protein-S-isoprenylcysteine O-methyltransferase Ste14